MKKYLQAGGNRYADAGNWHGYLMRALDKQYRMPEDETSPCVIASWNYQKVCSGSILTEITRMRTVFNQNGMFGKPVYNTEGSWGNGSLNDPDREAAWLARYYLLQAGQGINGVYWYGWDLETWGSLRQGESRVNVAGIAYDQLYGWLVGSTISAPCSPQVNGTTWSCNLSRPGGYRAMAIWDTVAIRTYKPPPEYRRYCDLSGHIFRVDGAVQVGPKPILLETSSPLKRLRL